MHIIRPHMSATPCRKRGCRRGCVLCDRSCSHHRRGHAHLAVEANLDTRAMHVSYYNQYSSRIPPKFGTLQSLIRLDMNSCTLMGPIPWSSHDSPTSTCSSLAPQYRQLTRKIPPELDALASLQSLDLSINNLNGEIPTSFAGLNNLTLLNLFRSQLQARYRTWSTTSRSWRCCRYGTYNFTGQRI